MYLNQILKSTGKKYPKIKFKGICFDTRKIKKHDILKEEMEKLIRS